MSGSGINILLELDDLNGLIYSIVSNVELRTEILTNKRKLLSVKPKLNSYNNKNEVSVRVFCMSDTHAKLDQISEVMFVKIEELEENFHEESLTVTPTLLPSSQILSVKNSHFLSSISKPKETPLTEQDITKQINAASSKHQCENCGQIFQRRSRLENHIKKNKCLVHSHMDFGNIRSVKRTLAYLPSGLELPNFNAIKKYPFNEKIIQPKIKRHTNSHENRLYECAHCDKKYQTRQTIWNHLTTTHFTRLTKHVCNECDPPRYFNQRKLFMKHCKTHKKEIRDTFKVEIDEKVKCPKCTIFVAKRSLNKHITKIHTTRENSFAVNSLYTCDECGKIFLEKRTLKNHKKSHLPDSEKPFKCQYCEKGFNVQPRLVEHERDHTGEKPYVCPHCQKAFAKKQTFKDHINIHTGNGYKCDHCEKTLWDHSSFRKHLKTHERELGVKLTYNREERRWADMGILDKVKDLL